VGLLGCGDSEGETGPSAPPESIGDGNAGMGGGSDLDSFVPASCESDADCGNASCVSGYCDVDDAVDPTDEDDDSQPDESSGGSVSSFAPAICQTDAECGGAPCLKLAEGDNFGHCDAAEIQVGTDTDDE